MDFKDDIVAISSPSGMGAISLIRVSAVSYTHLRAHETSLHLVCRLLLEKKAIQAFWKNYQSTLHKRRATFTKKLK